jgi:hypothetical protein
VEREERGWEGEVVEGGRGGGDTERGEGGGAAARSGRGGGYQNCASSLTS